MEVSNQSEGSGVAAYLVAAHQGDVGGYWKRSLRAISKILKHRIKERFAES